MRRAPGSRPEDNVALALAEVGRIKDILSRITDGRGLVVEPGTGSVDTTVPPETSGHTLYGVKHTRSFRVSDGGGLNVDYEQGQIWVAGTFYSVGSGTLALADNTTNYVFINGSGAMADNATGFPNDSWPVAQVTTVAGDITVIADRRSYAAQGVHRPIVVPTFEVEGDADALNHQMILIDATGVEWAGLTFQRSGANKGAVGLWDTTGAPEFGANDLWFAVNDGSWHDMAAFKNDGTGFELNCYLNVEGWARISADHATDPGNTTDGDLTFVRAFVNNDSNYSLAIVAANPRITYDTGDYVEYNRAGNYFTWVIGTTEIARLDSTGKFQIDGEIEIDGDLNHDGSNIGFFGTAPAAQAAAYTPTNVTPDRAYDADATTLDELADIVGTIISDLQAYGLLQ